jgi:hypothetical protein
MMLNSPYLSLPPPGAQLNRSCALANGLMFLARAWDQAQASVVDVVSGNNLTLTDGPTWSQSTSVGGILFPTTANGACAQIAVPAQLQLTMPYTHVVACQAPAGFATTGRGIFFFRNSSESATSGISTASTGIRAYYPQGAGSNAVIFACTVTAGVDYVFTLVTTSSELYFYQYSNGQLLSSQSASVSASNSSYTSSYLGLGQVQTPGIGGPGAVVYWGGLWKRALSVLEVASLGSVPSIGQAFRQPGVQAQAQMLQYVSRNWSISRDISGSRQRELLLAS